MQRKRELKFYATNTHQFPLILDAWLPRRGGETTWTNLQTKIFLFWSRTHKTIHFSKKFLLQHSLRGFDTKKKRSKKKTKKK